jgi:uncharacterized protein YceK
MDSKAGLFVGLAFAILTGGCGTIANTVGCDLNPPFREVPPPPPLDDGTNGPVWLNDPYWCLEGRICPLWQCSGKYQKQIYGGLQEDCLIWRVGHTTLRHYDIDAWLAVLDMPFSAIGDTITLPYILAYKNGRLDINIK